MTYSQIMSDSLIFMCEVVSVGRVPAMGNVFWCIHDKRRIVPDHRLASQMLHRMNRLKSNTNTTRAGEKKCKKKWSWMCWVYQQVFPLTNSQKTWEIKQPNQQTHEDLVLIWHLENDIVLLLDQSYLLHLPILMRTWKILYKWVWEISIPPWFGWEIQYILNIIISAHKSVCICTTL